MFVQFSRGAAGSGTTCAHALGHGLVRIRLSSVIVNDPVRALSELVRTGELSVAVLDGTCDSLVQLHQEHGWSNGRDARKEG